MNYIYVVNDISMGTSIITAESILSTLFRLDTWVFSDTAPFVKKMQPDDKFLVYFAGINRRYFVASFTVASELKKESLSPSISEEEFLRWYRYSNQIKDKKIWEPPLKIITLKDHLDFITDKKNWGLFFRQSIKQINENDYQYILQSYNQSTKI